MDDYNQGFNPNPSEENTNQQPQQSQQTQQPYPPNYYSGQQQYQQQGQPYQWNFENMQRQAQAEPPKKKHKGVKMFAIVAGSLAMLVVVVFAGFGIYVAATGNTLDELVPVPPALSQSEQMPQVSVNDKPAGTPAVGEAGLTNADIFKKVSPSVVGVINNVGINYFGQEMQDQGSGIILSADGYIITNAHVVEGATTLEVVLSDDNTYPATIIGSDPQTDLAVIKIDAANLPAAEFGNSDQLEVGERVVAIGNPGGLQFASSLTVGYVSALNRVLSSGDAGYALECIQTDAAINPGNSGGALINAYGQVVGINSAKINATDFEGMGFAIPISDAMPIIQDMINNGKVTGRAMMGITVMEVTASEAEASRLPMGLRIKEFTEGSDLPAKGAKVGDIITHINSLPVYNTTSSAEILKDLKPGDTVTLSLYRRDAKGRSGAYNIDIVLVGS